MRRSRTIHVTDLRTGLRLRAVNPKAVAAMHEAHKRDMVALDRMDMDTAYRRGFRLRNGWSGPSKGRKAQ